MSVTLKELGELAECSYQTDVPYDDAWEVALAAVLDRLADEADRGARTEAAEGVGRWLRSIAHPPALKREPDVEAAKDALKAMQTEVQYMREHVDAADAQYDCALRALGEEE